MPEVSGGKSQAVLTASPPQNRHASVVPLENQADTNDLDFEMAFSGIPWSLQGAPWIMRDTVEGTTFRPQPKDPFAVASENNAGGGVVSTVRGQHRPDRKP